MSRDRAVDALRGYAIAGVVLGHWLVTGLVLAPDGSLHQASPLAAMPALAPATWLLQTLGLFFFTAGYASARSAARHRGSGRWLAHRLRRLVLPAIALLGTGAAVLLAATVAGTPDDALAVALTLAVSPLWFLLPLCALMALTGPLRAAVRRWGPGWCAAPAVVVVAGADLAVRLLPSADALLPVSLLAAWAVPYLLGLAHADGRLAGRRAAAALAVGGAIGLAVLIAAGYPASAVGVPGAATSNLNPPSLVAVTLAGAQIGLGLLARPALLRFTSRPLPARAVEAVNRNAMRIYLWHQPVLVGVAALTARLAGTLPGLHTPPDGPGWVVARGCWLPVLAVVLAILVARRRAAPVPSRAARTRVPGGPERVGSTAREGVR
ncbi:acyltransferase [Micromonospora krabiensis]|uniref:Acyltransferase family protein n=1 Tax=Micromonospora krabiensis TaxID=307121 RepID=A0A1C3NDU1_9ACTN|nr:acyltransferase [Micromonospora krabiensis]SBV30756.1 Acyltransferase family protein [Micromonospora krabiensis]